MTVSVTLGVMYVVFVLSLGISLRQILRELEEAEEEEVEEP